MALELHNIQKGNFNDKIFDIVLLLNLSIRAGDPIIFAEISV